MDSLLVNDISLGSGQPVIMIHGMASSINDWSCLAPDLAGDGFHVRALDLLGHGDSHKPDDPGDYQIESIYQHFSAWIESLELATPSILVGHSLGGYLSLLHAMREPGSVRGLVLIDPFYNSRQLSPLLRLANRKPAVGGMLMRFSPQWLVHSAMGLNHDITTIASTEIRQQIASDYKRTSPYFVYIARDIPDLTSSLTQVKAPALVIWGEKDQSLKPSSFPLLVKALPNAQGHPISHAGHQPHISQYDLVKPMILEFIQELL